MVNHYMLKNIFLLKITIFSKTRNYLLKSMSWFFILYISLMSSLMEDSWSLITVSASNLLHYVVGFEEYDEILASPTYGKGGHHRPLEMFSGTPRQLWITLQTAVLIIKFQA